MRSWSTSRRPDAPFTVCGFAYSLSRVVGARARLFQRLTVTEMVTGVAWRYVWATVHCFSM